MTGDPTKRVKSRADIWPDQPDVPALNTLTPMVPSLLFFVFMVLLHATAPQTLVLQPLAAAEGFAARHRSHATNSFVKTSTLLRTLHLAVPSPFLTWELS